MPPAKPSTKDPASLPWPDLIARAREIAQVKVKVGKPITPSEVRKLATTFGVAFPEEYVAFLTSVGDVEIAFTRTIAGDSVECRLQVVGPKTIAKVTKRWREHFDELLEDLEEDAVGMRAARKAKTLVPLLIDGNPFPEGTIAVGPKGETYSYEDHHEPHVTKRPKPGLRAAIVAQVFAGVREEAKATAAVGVEAIAREAFPGLAPMPKQDGEPKALRLRLLEETNAWFSLRGDPTRPTLQAVFVDLFDPTINAELAAIRRAWDKVATKHKGIEGRFWRDRVLDSLVARAALTTSLGDANAIDAKALVRRVNELRAIAEKLRLR